MSEEVWIRPGEVAAIFTEKGIPNVDARRVTDWRERGKLPYREHKFPWGASEYLYPKSEIERIAGEVEISDFRADAVSA